MPGCRDRAWGGQNHCENMGDVHETGRTSAATHVFLMHTQQLHDPTHSIFSFESRVGSKFIILLIVKIAKM